MTSTDSNPFKPAPRSDQLKELLITAFSHYRTVINLSGGMKEVQASLWLLQADLTRSSKQRGLIGDLALLESWIDDCFPSTFIAKI